MFWCYNPVLCTCISECHGSRAESWNTCSSEFNCAGRIKTLYYQVLLRPCIPTFFFNSSLYQIQNMVESLKPSSSNISSMNTRVNKLRPLVQTGGGLFVSWGSGWATQRMSHLQQPYSANGILSSAWRCQTGLTPHTSSPSGNVRPPLSTPLT